MTLWTGSTVPQPSTFRDLEARARLRDFDLFYTAIGIPERYVFKVPSKARTALTGRPVGACLTSGVRSARRRYRKAIQTFDPRLFLLVFLELFTLIHLFIHAMNRFIWNRFSIAYQ